MSVFGFSTKPASANFTPIIKYYATTGLITRVDRSPGADGKFESNEVDITAQFKALADFDNLEVGWINFAAGGAPSMLLVKRGEQWPHQPNTQHKEGVRFMLKLPGAIAGGAPIREIASNAKNFLRGLEAVVELWLSLKDRPEHKGKLPQIALEGNPAKVKTGFGARSSENYEPRFKIIGWSPRGDLVWQPRDGSKENAVMTAEHDEFGGPGPRSSTRAAEQQTYGNGQRPSTGATRAEAPQARPQAPARPPAVEYDPNDFG